MNYFIANVSADTVNVDVPKIDRTKWRDLGIVTVKDGREHSYALDATDPHYPASLKVGCYQQSSNKTRTIIKISDRAVITDDAGTNVLLDEEISAQLTLITPGVSGLHNPAEVLAMVGNLYSALFSAVTSGDPTLTVVNALANNIPTI